MTSQPMPTSMKCDGRLSGAESSMTLDDLVSTCLPYVRAYAYSHYRDSLWHSDVEDLIQYAMLWMIEHAAAAFQAREPVRYAMRMAINAMGKYFRTGQDSLVPVLTDPRKPSRVPPLVMSLDASVDDGEDDGEDDLTLCGAISLYECSDTSCDYAELYAALGRLRALQREAVLRRFGLGGYGQVYGTEMGKEEGRAKSTMNSRVELGLKSLRCDLELCMALATMADAGRANREYAVGGAA